jgi:hypothetical protein
VQPISSEDYFTKHAEFAAWLKDLRGKFFRSARIECLPGLPAAALLLACLNLCNCCLYTLLQPLQPSCCALPAPLQSSALLPACCDSTSASDCLPFHPLSATCSEQTTEVNRAMFDEFAEAWNGRRLPARFYTGDVARGASGGGARTSHSWGIKGG